jgi:molybdopterin-binding protein
MKLSARNALPGTVIAIVRGATTAQVKIDVGQGIVVTAAVTNAAVDALKLEIGKPATAVVKASDVMIGIDE